MALRYCSRVNGLPSLRAAIRAAVASSTFSPPETDVTSSPIASAESGSSTSSTRSARPNAARTTATAGSEMASLRAVATTSSGSVGSAEARCCTTRRVGVVEPLHVVEAQQRATAGPGEGEQERRDRGTELLLAVVLGQLRRLQHRVQGRGEVA